MSPEELEGRLRSLKTELPFRPFVVEMADGEAIIVDRADGILFPNGAEALLASEDQELHFISPEYVRNIRLLPREPTMSPEDFDQSLRAFLRRQPFQPFLVELKEGRSFLVDDPEAVAFCNGAAGFIALKKEVFLFTNENTVDMRLASPEVVS